MLQDCYYVLLIQLGIIMLSERMKRVCMADAAPKFGRIIMCTLLGGDAHRIGNVPRQIIEFQRCAVSVYEICHNAKTAESVVVFVGFCVDVLDTYFCVGYMTTSVQDIFQYSNYCRFIGEVTMLPLSNLHRPHTPTLFSLITFLS